MSIQTASPNVTSREATYTILTQGDSSVACGMVGFFEWGPCFDVMQVIDEETLIEIFGKPNSENYEHWFTAFSYLAYSKNMQVVRSVNKTTAKNAGVILVDIDAATPAPVTLVNPTIYNSKDPEPLISFSAGQKIGLYAKYPGSFGNRISIACANNTDFSTSNLYTGVSFINAFDFAPKTDEFAIAIFLDDVLMEKHICSININGLDDSGNSSYFESVLNNSSGYVNAVDNILIEKNISSFEKTLLVGGVASIPTEADIILGYDEFEDEGINVNIIIDGANTSSTIQQNIIDNIAEVRQDCVAYLGPVKSDVVNVALLSTVITNLTEYIITDIARSTSFGAFFGNWKLMFDHINNKDRWVPITGDMAGIYARTVIDKEPWYSGFGPTYGKMKNVKRLAINPKQSYRNTIYKGRVNPVYTDAQDGPILFGNKTMLSANTPFNRLDVRFLFIFIREAIDKTARAWLGEKNTAFQRRRFVNSIEPFLEDVQGREGIGGGAAGEIAFYVQCDETNNPAQIRDQGAFVGRVLVKPTHTIEFISLTYTSVGGDVSFEEVITTS